MTRTTDDADQFREEWYSHIDTLNRLKSADCDDETAEKLDEHIRELKELVDDVVIE